MSFANTLLYVRTVPPINTKDSRETSGEVLDGDDVSTNEFIEELGRNED